jgi:WD40 repeat protein
MPNKSSAEVWSANFSPDGKQIVSASIDNNLKLWDLAGNCLQTFVGHTAEVWSANFSHNLFAIWAEICTRNRIRMPNKSLQTITC